MIVLYSYEKNDAEFQTPETEISGIKKVRVEFVPNVSVINTQVPFSLGLEKLVMGAWTYLFSCQGMTGNDAPHFMQTEIIGSATIRGVMNLASPLLSLVKLIVCEPDEDMPEPENANMYMEQIDARR